MKLLNLCPKTNEEAAEAVEDSTETMFEDICYTTKTVDGPKNELEIQKENEESQTCSTRPLVDLLSREKQPILVT